MVPSLLANSHVVVRNFIDRRLAKTLYNLLLIREFRGEFKRDDQVPRALSFWGCSTLDAFLVSLLPDVEEVAGCSLLPTYCYARLYLHGDVLNRHSDREACEIAATIHVGHSGMEPPPICFAPDHSVSQQPGDAVVYLGDKLDHWRDTFMGTNFGQVFVNYVRADGPHRHLAFDGRHRMFPPAVLGPASGASGQGAC
jgi:hypothetical protein